MRNCARRERSLAGFCISELTVWPGSRAVSARKLRLNGVCRQGNYRNRADPILMLSRDDRMRPALCDRRIARDDRSGKGRAFESAAFSPLDRKRAIMGVLLRDFMGTMASVPLARPVR